MPSFHPKISSLWKSHLREDWQNLWDSAHPGLICIDFDNSFLRGDYGEQVMVWLLENGYPENWDTEFCNFQKLFSDPSLAESEYRKARAIGDFHPWKDYVFSEYLSVRDREGLGGSYRWSSFIFSGWTESDFRTLSRRIWFENLTRYNENRAYYRSYPMPPDMAVHPREPLLDLVEAFLEKSWTVQIVTASPSFAVQETTAELGLTKEDVIGMDLVMDDSGKTTPVIREPYPYGEGKVSAIHNKFSRKPDISFGDTINDYPMLLSATKKAVLFDRGYSELNEKTKNTSILLHPWI